MHEDAVDQRDIMIDFDDEEELEVNNVDEGLLEIVE